MNEWAAPKFKLYCQLGCTWTCQTLLDKHALPHYIYICVRARVYKITLVYIFSSYIMLLNCYSEFLIILHIVQILLNLRMTCTYDVLVIELSDILCY